MEIRDKIHQNAMTMIIQANPQLAREIERATEADLCGQNRAEYRQSRIVEAMQNQAELHGMHVWDYQVALAEESGIDVSAIRMEDLELEANALGIDELL